MNRNPIARADVSGTEIARAVAQCYMNSSAPTQPFQTSDQQPDAGLGFARGVVVALCIASVLWSGVVVYLSFTLS